MKKKTFIILIVILGILMGAGALMMQFETPRQATVAMGSSLLDTLPANDVVVMQLEGAGSPVTLKKTGNQWVVEERFNYPANFERIADFVRDLKDAEVGRAFAASDDVLERLSLTSPGETDVPGAQKAMRICMKDADGQVVLDLLVGDTRTRGEKKLPDGQFVMLRDDPQVYLIDQTLTAYLTGPAEWLAESPVEVKADEVKGVRCMTPDGETVRFAFARPEKGKPFEWVDPEAGKKIKQSALNRLTNALSSLDISDVADPSTMPEAVQSGVSPCLIYRLYNEMVYRVYPGKECAGGADCYIRFEVAYQAPPQDQQETAEAEKPKQEGTQEPDPEQIAQKAEAENDRLRPWVFVIPKWQHKAFMTQLDELVETEKEKGKS